MPVLHRETVAVRDESEDTASIDPHRRLELIHDCRELALTSVVRIVAGALERMGDELSARALRLSARSPARAAGPDPANAGLHSAAGGLDTQQALLDAVSLVRRSRAAIETHFREIYSGIYDSRSRGDWIELDGSALFADSELPSIDGREASGPVSVDGLVQRIRSRLDPDEVLGVRARMGALLERDWFDESQHPVAPEAVFEAFGRALGALGVKAALRDTLQCAFEPHLSANLGDVHVRLNDLLRSNQVLPRIRARLVAAPPSEPRASRAAGPALAVAVASFGADLPVLGTPAPQGQPVAAALLETLDALQSGGGRSARGLVPLSTELKELVSESGSQIDRRTVDAVSRVFDQLYTDRQLPGELKQHLLRLQVVAVKSTLIDRSFFVRREHPMRRLIDAICVAATDPDAQVDGGSDLLGGIGEIVDWVIASFDWDLSVFDDAVARLEMVVSIELQRRGEQLEALAVQASRLEALSVAHEEARAELALRFEPSTPAFVREFLDCWWARSIAKARVDAAGADDDGVVDVGILGDAGLAPLRCAESVIWSVAPKAPADVPRLAKLLPTLIGELMLGLRHTGIADGVRERFFDELMQWHTREIEQAKHRSQSPLKFPKVAAPSAPDPDPCTGHQALAPSPLTAGIRQTLDILHPGMLLELGETDGSLRRMRVAWIGASRRLFMLTRHPRVVRSLAETELGQLFESGRARIADPDTALDRALRAAATDGRASVAS